MIIRSDYDISSKIQATLLNLTTINFTATHTCASCTYIYQYVEIVFIIYSSQEIQQILPHMQLIKGQAVDIHVLNPKITPYNTYYGLISLTANTNFTNGQIININIQAFTGNISLVLSSNAPFQMASIEYLIFY